jgi:hypothetical protein
MKRGISSPAERDETLFDEVFKTKKAKGEHPATIEKYGTLFFIESPLVSPKGEVDVLIKMKQLSILMRGKSCSRCDPETYLSSEKIVERLLKQKEEVHFY